jgi:hypothetical protein
MSIIKRLQRLTGESPRQKEKLEHSGESEASCLSITLLRRRVDMILARRTEGRAASFTLPTRRSSSLQEVIPGEECFNDAGVCFIQENEIDAFCRHGHRHISDFAGLNIQAASFLANNSALGCYRLEDGLFLDTETTGLAGGTGTMAFLIGMGWFDRGRFIVRQILVRDFTEERAALTQLAEIVGAMRFLVSFNGKTFDVGLLSARYVMNRLQDPFTQMPHLDLLYPARRLIAHRLGNCRLSTLEEQVLGLIRHGDVAGSDIPQRYFDWLRSGDACLLKDVFEHNRLDIISLAALMDHLTDMIDGRRDNERVDARDLLAVARLYADRQDTLQAQSILSSVSQSHDAVLRMEARKMLSLLHKGAGLWEDAVGLWRQMIRDDPGDLFALVELAKWYEHRVHDHATALKLVGLALEQADIRNSKMEREALLHRRQRLQRRQAQQTRRND